jgi:hypothetical protein
MGCSSYIPNMRLLVYMDDRTIHEVPLMETIVIQMICDYKQEWPNSQKLHFRPVNNLNVTPSGNIKFNDSDLELEFNHPDKFPEIQVNDIVEVTIK